MSGSMSSAPSQGSCFQHVLVLPEVVVWSGTVSSAVAVVTEFVAGNLVAMEPGPAAGELVVVMLAVAGAGF